LETHANPLPSDFDLKNMTKFRLPQYDPLKDRNLSKFFNDPKKRNHLLKMGLITESGHIITNPEEYQRRKEFYDKVFNS
jgi:hypothetical protein